MITVYVLVTFYDDAGIHYAGTICKVKAENFDPRFMKKVKSPSEYVYSKTEVDEMLLKKQDDLTAGTNIQISDEDVISATDTGDTVSVTQVQTTGTKIATVTVNSVGTDIYAPAGGGGGGSTDIIADEFDTEPVIVPSVYDKYDIVRVATGSPWNYYWSKNDNNSDEPGQSSKWQSSSAPVTIDTWGTSIPAYGIGKTSGDVYYVNTSASSEWVNPSQGQIPSAVKEAVWKDIWSEGTESYHQYAVGDYCIYNDELYRCNTATTGENWVAASWTQTQVMDELETSAVQTITFTNLVSDVLEVGNMGTLSGAPVLGPINLIFDASTTIRGTIIQLSGSEFRLTYVSSDVSQLNAVDFLSYAANDYRVSSVKAVQLSSI